MLLSELDFPWKMVSLGIGLLGKWPASVSLGNLAPWEMDSLALGISEGQFPCQMDALNKKGYFL